MNNNEYEEQLKEDALAEEKRDMDLVWRKMVKAVLSTTRIDPNTRGKQLEMFIPFTGEVTDEHIRALQSSNYGLSFISFIELWKSRLAPKQWDDIDQGAELFRRLSTTTASCFREIQHYEKEGKRLTDEEILRAVPFLTTDYWDSNHSNFGVNEVSEQLNLYLTSGMEWDHIDKSLLRMCVRRAYDVEQAKKKSLSAQLTERWFDESSVFGFFVSIALRVTGYVLPELIAFVVVAGIFLWSINNLDSSNHPFIAFLGLLYVAISVVSMGTREIRHTLKRIVRPPYPEWNEIDPFVDADLYALNQAVNHLSAPHTNLRLAREQLIRLQNTELQFPVQLLTFIDRAISKGEHYW